ncbi:hypothetical protein PR048_018117 [Dryococelus australis]|uniref:Uncharacterized protein n=1 Tax=Dryococelus australis TaxID=614101 RepID=A0ABQ9HBQ8_9NEOP|nr:hypothetical protein PR048_018117 [Dryococelus australis]
MTVLRCARCRNFKKTSSGTSATGNRHTPLKEAPARSIVIERDTREAVKVLCEMFARISILQPQREITLQVIGNKGRPNKNPTVLTMIPKCLLRAPANVTSVQLVFPVVGYSFLPSDRVFDRTEKGENHIYRTDIGIERGITKKNTSFMDASPHKLPIGIPVTEKVNDVGNLMLKHFGFEWKSLDSLQWYKRIVESNDQNVNVTEKKISHLCERAE